MSGRAGLLQEIDGLFQTGTLGQLPDAELLRRFVSGGPDAERSFEVLVDRHGPMVLAACRRLLRDPADAQDAFQATFLVLARKAGRVGRPERLASWLFGVASRTAMKARVGNARRRRHEQIRAASVAEGIDPRDDSEVRRVIHEEIARLPEKYRAPVILCHLEGMTRERASAQLQCPEGTVGVRLMRARQRLRAAMVRRGFAGAVGALAIDLGAPAPASAAVPAGLAAATARAGTAFAAGRADAAGLVSTHVLSLTQGVLTHMRTTRFLILAPAVLLAGAVAAGAAVLASRANPPEPAKPVAAPAVDPARADRPRWKQTLPGGETVELIGVSPEQRNPKTWWGPDGSPLAEPAFDHLQVSLGKHEEQKSRVFAVRLSGVADPAQVGVTWKFRDAGSSGSASPPSKSGVFGAVASLPEGAKATTVSFGVASGPWQTRATTAGFGRGMSSMGPVVFTKTRATKDGIALAVTDTFLDANVRVVAVDRDGKEHGPSENQVLIEGSARTFRVHDLAFDLPLDRLREVRLQTRPYAWAEFRDVAIEPAPR